MRRYSFCIVQVAEARSILVYLKPNEKKNDTENPWPLIGIVWTIQRLVSEIIADFFPKLTYRTEIHDVDAEWTMTFEKLEASANLQRAPHVTKKNKKTSQTERLCGQSYQNFQTHWVGTEPLPKCSEEGEFDTAHDYLNYLLTRRIADHAPSQLSMNNM